MRKESCSTQTPQLNIGIARSAQSCRSPSGSTAVRTTFMNDGIGLTPSARSMTSSRIRFRPAILLLGTQASLGRNPWPDCGTECRGPDRSVQVREGRAQASSRCRVQVWEIGRSWARWSLSKRGWHRGARTLHDSAHRTPSGADRSESARRDPLDLRHRRQLNAAARRWIENPS